MVLSDNEKPYMLARSSEKLNQDLRIYTIDHIDSLENLSDEVEFCQEPTVEYMKKGDHGELSSETMMSINTISIVQLGKYLYLSFEFATMLIFAV